MQTEVAVRAAGGVVIRGDTVGQAEVVVVHRPRYGDWTLPKGKHDPGEDSSACAVREVEEETGWSCRPVDRAATSRYNVGEGLKEVDYFVMRPIRYTGFEPNEEVDDVRWIPPAAADGLLTYPFDRDLLSAIDLGRATGQRDLHIVRHGAAGKRSEWEGPDEERPLTSEGALQADMIASETADVGVERIESSPYLRCVQTVEPLAERLGLPVERADALAEGADRGSIAALLDDVAGSRVMLCSHGDVIPAALELLQQRGVRFRSASECSKGSTWVIGHDGHSYTDAVYLPPPNPPHRP